MRVKAVISYDGASFRGFQKQKSTKQTITTAIEEALISIGINSNIRGSGRTDAGVHATGQVIDFVLPKYWRDLEKLQEVLNKKLRYISFKRISWSMIVFMLDFQLNDEYIVIYLKLLFLLYLKIDISLIIQNLIKSY